MRRVVLLSFLVATGAGCVADDVVPVSATTAGPSASGPETSEDLGGINGLVLNDQIEPIGDVAVVLDRQGAADVADVRVAATTPAGTFEFSLLEPGTYLLSANHSLYSPAGSLVQVNAGEISQARLTLSQRPTQLPYIDVRVFAGITGCDSIGAVVTFFVIGGICPTQAGSAPGYSANFTDSWRYIVWENTWDAASEGLGFLISPSSFTCDQEPCYGVKAGPPPLRLEAAPGQKMQDDVDFYNAPTGSIIPYPEGAFETAVGAYHGGLYSQETTQAMQPTGYCPGYCYGVGTTLERRFTIFESTFHFEGPADPALYSALPDA